MLINKIIVKKFTFKIKITTIIIKQKTNNKKYNLLNFNCLNIKKVFKQTAQDS